jgi:hypothetical protein
MICPHCHNRATTLSRFSLTKQGVTFVQSTQGFLKCMQCGSLLKVTMFRRPFWILFTAAMLLVLIYAFNFRASVSRFGFDTMATIWIILVASLFGIFTIGMLKYSHVEKAE